MNTTNSSDFDQEQIQARLVTIAEKDRNGVILFAVRCALRGIPRLTISSNKGFHFKQKQRLNMVRIWRACYLTLQKCCNNGRLDLHEPALGVYEASVEAINSDIENIVLAAKDAADTGAEIFREHATHGAAIRNGTRLAASAAFRVALIDSESLFADLLLLEQGKLTVFNPLCCDTSVVNKQIDIDSFVSACGFCALEEIADAYSVLFYGGEKAQHLIEQSWEVYDELWAEVQKHPDISQGRFSFGSKEPHIVVDVVSEKDQPINKGTTSDAYNPGSSYWAESLSDTDHLNRGPLIDALARWIGHKANTSHISLGLFGHWGTGKSTFLKLLKNRLTSPSPSEPTEAEVKIIWGEFNAWRYEHSDNIQAGIAQEVVTALKQSIGWRNRLVLTTKFACKQYSWRLLGVAGAIIGSVGLWCVGGELTFTDSGTPEVVAGLSAQLVIGVFLYQQLKQILSHPMANQLKTYLRLPDFGPHLGTIPVMHEQIKTLLKLRLTILDRPFWQVFSPKPLQRFVLVVDDLDRCSHEGVVKTLEAVRLVMDLPNVVVIVAIDPRVALASLALYYEKLSEHHAADPISIARDYLAKVIHVPIVLEAPQEMDIHRYLEQHLWKYEDEMLTVEAESRTPVISNIGEVKTVSAPSVATGINNLGKSAEPDSTETAATRPSAPDQKSTPITGLSPAQKQVFKDWISRFNFSNPRQIKRLNNAYALIRLRYADEDEAETDGGTNDIRFPRLVMMLWLEYLHELSTTDRCVMLQPLQDQAFDQESWAVNLTPRQKKHSQWWDQVKGVIPEAQRWKVYQQIRAFVLPAVEPVASDEIYGNGRQKTGVEEE